MRHPGAHLQEVLTPGPFLVPPQQPSNIAHGNKRPSSMLLKKGGTSQQINILNLLLNNLLRNLLTNKLLKKLKFNSERNLLRLPKPAFSRLFLLTIFFLQGICVDIPQTCLASLGYVNVVLRTFKTDASLGIYLLQLTLGNFPLQQPLMK